MTLCLPATTQAQSAYDVTFLDPGQYFMPGGINNAGQIVASIASVNAGDAVYWDKGVIHDVTASLGYAVGGVAISDNGYIAINASDPAASNAHPAIYNMQTNSLQIITQFQAGADLTGVNNNGDVSVGSGVPGIYHYSTNTFEQVKQPSGYIISELTSINNNGVAAGEYNEGAGYYSNGTFTDIGGIGGYASIANHITDNGILCGQSYSPYSYQHGFLYQNGQLQDLGTLQPNTVSDALGVNKYGVTVGWSGDQPFIYQNGKMQDLFDQVDPSLGLTQGRALAINDSGWIVGTSNMGSFLAIPRAAATPAPGSLLTFGTGIGVMLLAARFRKRKAAAH